MKVKKDDFVVILSGDDKGKKGKVLKSFPKTGKILVDGINKVTRHQKATQTAAPGKVEKCLPIFACKVAKIDGTEPVKKDAKKASKNKE